MQSKTRKEIIAEIKNELKNDIREKIHNPPYLSKRTIGQKASDSLTKWVGSWTFIIFTISLIIFWISINSYWLLFGRELDPFPFILLNLALSTLAAIQAPIILMSQNRQSERDRIRAEYDYYINRHSAKEIQIIDKQLDRIEKKIDEMKKKRR